MLRRYSSSQRVVSRSRWFVGSSRRRTSAGRDELPREAQPSALAAAQLLERLRARVLRVEAEAVEHGVDARRRRCSRPRARSARGRCRSAPARLRDGSCARAAACSARERSSASSSANGTAAASQTVVAPPKSRCCSRSETRSPGRRAIEPRVGFDAPRSRRRKSVVLPVPLRPTIPQRSPRPKVKEMSWRIGIAAEVDGDAGEGEEAHFPTQSRHSSSAGADGEAIAGSDERLSQEERLFGQLLEPAVVGVVGVPEPELARTACDSRSIECVDAEFLCEAAQLAGGGGTHVQVDEVGLDAPLGEEAQRLAGIGALLRAEDLNFHGGQR